MPYKDRLKQKKAQRLSYERNRRKIYQRNNERRNEFYEWCNSLKDRPCMDCEGRFPYYVMHWDHRSGEDRIMAIAQLRPTLNREVILTEIAKCDLVCANCHAIRTHKRNTYFGRAVVAESVDAQE